MHRHNSKTPSGLLLKTTAGDFSWLTGVNADGSGMWGGSGMAFRINQDAAGTWYLTSRSGRVYRVLAEYGIYGPHTGAVYVIDQVIEPEPETALPSSPSSGTGSPSTVLS